MATYYWTGGSGVWEDASKWSLTSGVAPSNPSTITSITNVISGAGGGTAVTTPTSGTNDDGSFTLALPFSISYLGASYSTIYISTNGYITFTAGFGTIPTGGFNSATVASPALSICASGDISCQRIYFETLGTVGTRTYRVRYEGTNATTGTLGAPNKIYEVIFYEATPEQIDIHYGPTMTGGLGTAPGIYSATNLIRAFPSTPSTSVSYRITTTSGSVAIPTSVDDIVFDSASSSSSYTVSIFGATAALTFTNWTASGPAAGTLTFVGGVALTINGSISFTSTGVAISTYSGTMTFPATSGSYTISLGGVSLASVGGITIGPNAASTATWTLGGSLSISSNILQIRSGTFNTANFNVTCRFQSTGTITRTINLGTSTISSGSTSAAFVTISSTNLTLNASNSTFIKTGSSIGSGVIDFTLGTGLSYGTIIIQQNPFNNTTGSQNIATGSAGGSVTINTLTYSGANSKTAFIFGNNSTYNIGTFNMPTTSAGSRIMISGDRPYANAIGPTLNVTTINFPGNHIDFMGITATGSATWTSSIDTWGDAGYNSGITFTASRTLYYTGGTQTTGLYTVPSAWALTSGGANSGFSPRAHDDIIIDNNSGAAGITIAIGASTNSIGYPCFRSVDMSNRTTSMTLTSNSYFLKENFFGSSSATTVAETQSVILIGNTDSNISLNGMLFPAGLSVVKAGGANLVTLQSAFNSRAGFSIVIGTLQTNSFNISCTAFSTDPSTITGRSLTVNSGSSLITITGSGGWSNTLSGVTPTFNTSRTTVLFNQTGTTTGQLSSSTTGVYSPTSIKYILGGTSTGIFTITSTLTTFRVPYFESIRRNAVIRITAGRTAQFDDIKIASNIGNRVTLSSTSSTSSTISSPTGKKFDFDYIDVSYLTATQTNTFYAGRNGTSVIGTNTNWIFGSYSRAPQKGNALAFLG